MTIEMTPPGSGKLHMSESERRAVIERMRKNGKKADEIRAQAKEHAENIEIPQAEKKIDDQIARMNFSQKNTNFLENKHIDDLSPFWKKVLKFFLDLWK